MPLTDRINEIRHPASNLSTTIEELEPRFEIPNGFFFILDGKKENRKYPMFFIRWHEEK